MPPAGMPHLPPPSLFRLDWFATFAQMVLNIIIISAITSDDWRCVSVLACVIEVMDFDRCMLVED